MARFKASRVRLFANGFAAFCFAVIFLSFVTPYWLTSDRRYYGAVFVRLGLWETCFRSFHDPDDLAMRKYYAGCRWILTDEYQKLRSFIEQCEYLSNSMKCNLSFLKFYSFLRMKIFCSFIYRFTLFTFSIILLCLH